MSKAVAKRGIGELAPGQAPRGLEGFNKKDLMLPKALLMQGLSKLVTREGKKVGDFVHSITQESLGTSFEFIPVSATKYFDLLKPEGDKMVFDDRVYDENDPKLRGRIFFPDKAKGIKADATSVISYICIVDGDPLILSFSKTSYRAGKKLGTMAFTSGKDLFATKYKIASKSESKNDNDFFIMEIEEVGVVTKDEFAAAEKLYDSFGKRIAEIYKNVSSDDDAHVTPTSAEPVNEAPAEEEAPESVDSPSDFTEEETAKPAFTKVRVLMDVKTDADKACKKCGEPRILKDGKVKTNDPETDLPWGKVKALVCKKCNLLDVVEKIAD